MAIVNEPIEVSSVYDTNKEIKPIKFRALTCYLEDFTNINRIVRKDKEKIQGNVVTTFTCEIIQEDMRVLWDIRYNHDNSSWVLYKI